MKGMVGAMVLVTLLWVAACERLTQPRLGSEALALQELSTLVTETYLKLEGIERFPRGTLKLYRNGKALWERPLTLADTVLYDSTLQPAQRYTYRAELWAGNRQLAQSAPVTVTTMDTTSHNFEWEVIEFPSPYGSGALYDVAIINENNIWAVGEIYSDSAQPWLPYNAVHWDGEKWELKRIQFRYFCNQPETFPAPASSVIAFGPKDVFIAAGSQLAHWNGEKQDGLECIPVSVNKMWGTDKNNIYAVGAIGKIAHYDGRRWRRIESGTDQYLQDIWGVVDQKTGQPIVYIAASHRLGYGEKKIIRIKEKSEIDSVFWPFDRVVMSIWAAKPYQIFTCGEGIFRLSIEKSWKEIGGSNVIPAFTEKIRGQAENDIFVVGHYGVVAHFNGLNFRVYPELAVAQYRSCDYQKNLMVGVGMRSSRVVILKMWRR